MIALTISDTMDAGQACARVSRLLNLKKNLSVPDAVCIRYDSLDPEQYISMVEAITELWNGEIVLECEDATIMPKVMLRMLDRRPYLFGTNDTNLEQYCMVADMFKCPLILSNESLESLLDMVQKAKELGVDDIILDPKINDMNQCLESTTDLKRLAERIPEADHPVMVKTWSGEYALTMSIVSLLDGVSLIIVDDLDDDCCDVLGALSASLR